MNQNKILLSQCSTTSQIYTIPKTYVQLTGSHITALVLNQCIYYAGISQKENSEFYKTYYEWFKETYLTKRQVSLSIEKLKKLNFITTRVKKVNNTTIVHYLVILDNVKNAIYKISESEITENDKMSLPGSDKMLLPLGNDKMLLPGSDKMSLPYIKENDLLTNDLKKTYSYVGNFLDSKKTQEIFMAQQRSEISYPDCATNDDLFSAIEYSLSITPKEIPVNARYKQILRFLKEGTFRPHPDWVKSKNKEKIKIDVEQRIKLQEQASINKALEQFKQKKMIDNFTPPVLQVPPVPGVPPVTQVRPLPNKYWRFI